MPDNPARRGPQDRTRINLNERHEIRYWTKEFDVDEELLRDTVGQFGPLVKDVREAIEHLKSGQRRGPRQARPSPTRT